MHGNDGGGGGSEGFEGAFFLRGGERRGEARGRR